MNTSTLLSALPDTARVWTFAVLGEPGTVVADLRAFCDRWTSHSRSVPADAADVTPDGFPGLILAVGAQLSDAEVNAGVSGCGIDAMQHAVEASVAAAGGKLAHALTVAFRDDDDAWQVVLRPAFRKLTKRGDADGATRVIDLTATTLGQLRANGVERPALEAWHGRTFRLTAKA